MTMGHQTVGENAERGSVEVVRRVNRNLRLGSTAGENGKRHSIRKYRMEGCETVGKMGHRPEPGKFEPVYRASSIR